jgi:hypothetical protein
MFQPRAKLEFVRRYCPPNRGWHVCVDIDGSEKGTAGKRTKESSIKRGLEMQADWFHVEKELRGLKVRIGNYPSWCKELNLSTFGHRPDIATYHSDRGCIIAEVEAQSTGQPEDKVYMAVGQIMLAASVPISEKWKPHFFVVVHGSKMVDVFRRMTQLTKIPIFGFSLADNEEDEIVIRSKLARNWPRSLAALLDLSENRVG